MRVLVTAQEMSCTPAKPLALFMLSIVFPLCLFAGSMFVLLPGNYAATDVCNYCRLKDLTW